MTVITTTTVSTATAYSNQRKIDRTQNGVLWAMYWDGTSNTTSSMHFRYSTDDGATWTDGGGFGFAGTGTTYTPNGSFFIDVDDYAHVAYKDRHDGYIYYRRGTPNAARTAYTWSAAQLVSPYTALNHPDIVAHPEGTGWKAHIVWGASYSNYTYTYYNSITISSTGVITRDGSDSGASLGFYANSNTMDSYPSIDFHHTGDAKTIKDNLPHIFVAWSAGETGAGKGIRFMKASYSGGSWTWGTEREIDSTSYANGGRISSAFDGTRAVIAYADSGSTSSIKVRERDAADTTTTTRTPSLLSDGVVTGLSVSYDDTGNTLLGAVGDTSDDVKLLKYDRTAGTWGAWETVATASAQAGTLSLERGYSENAIGVLYTDGTASPYSVTYDSISLTVFKNASDTAALGVTETTDRLYGKIASEQVDVLLTESTYRFVTLTAADTAAITATETQNRFNDLPGSDQHALGIVETTEFYREISSSDSLVIDLSDFGTFFREFVSADDLAFGVADDAWLTKGNMLAEDTVFLGVTDTSSLYIDNALPGSDALHMAAVESIQVFKEISSSDSSVFAISESSAQFSSVPSSDSLNITVQESASYYTVNYLPGADNAHFGMSETVSIHISDLVSASDVCYINVDENATQERVVEPVAAATAVELRKKPVGLWPLENNKDYSGYGQDALLPATPENHLPLVAGVANAAVFDNANQGQFPCPVFQQGYENQPFTLEANFRSIKRTEGIAAQTQRSYRSVVSEDNPNIHLPLNGTLENVGSSTTVTGTKVTYGSGMEGQGAAWVTGVTDSVITLPQPITAPTLTVEIWHKHNPESTNWKDAFSAVSNDHFMIIQQNSTRIGMFIDTNAGAGGTGFQGHTSAVVNTDGNWHHYVHVITAATATTAGTCKQYIDGQLVGQITHALDTNAVGVSRIGNWQGSYPFQPFDEPAIYTYGLTAERILKHYQTGIASNGDDEGWEWSGEAYNSESIVVPSEGEQQVLGHAGIMDGLVVDGTRVQFVTKHKGYEDVVRDSKPLAYWRLEEESGSIAIDSSGNGRNGIIGGSRNVLVPSALADGSFGKEQAWVYSENPELAVTDRPYSLEVWIRRTDPSLVLNNEYCLSTSVNGTYDACIRFQGASANSTGSIGGWHRDAAGSLKMVAHSGYINVDEWNHFVTTWDGSNVKGYLNGVLVATNPATSAYATGRAFTRVTASSGVPAHNATSPNSYTGKKIAIDEPAIYDRVLTPEEIAAHYQARTLGPSGEVSAEYDLQVERAVRVSGVHTNEKNSLYIDGELVDEVDIPEELRGQQYTASDGYLYSGASQSSQGLAVNSVSIYAQALNDESIKENYYAVNNIEGIEDFTGMYGGDRVVLSSDRMETFLTRVWNSQGDWMRNSLFERAGAMQGEVYPETEDGLTVAGAWYNSFELDAASGNSIYGVNMEWDGTGVTMEASLDGTTWVPVERGRNTSLITEGFDPTETILHVRALFEAGLSQGDAVLRSLEVNGYIDGDITVHNIDISATNTSPRKDRIPVEFRDDWGAYLDGGSVSFAPVTVDNLVPVTVEVWSKSMEELSVDFTPDAKYINSDNGEFEVGEWIVTHYVVNAGLSTPFSISGTGQIGHVVLYSRPLTQTEASEIINSYFETPVVSIMDESVIGVTQSPEGTTIYAHEWTIEGAG